MVEAPEAGGAWALRRSEVAVEVVQQPGPKSEHAALIAKALVARAGDSLDGLWVESASDWMKGVRSGIKGPGIRMPEVHAWMGMARNDAAGVSARELVARWDMLLARDRIPAVVSVSNDPRQGVPDLLASSFHALAVGCADGGHGAGTTTDGFGPRHKPDLVVDARSTSLAAAQAGGVLARMWEHTEADSEARAPEVIRAVLLATASREASFFEATSAWRPFHPVLGAGVLNGEAAEAVVLGERVGSDWSFVRVTPSASWFQDVEISSLGEWSVAASWNLSYDVAGEVMPPADVTLTVFRVNAEGGLLEKVGGSNALVGNHELASVRESGPGRYRVVVTTDRAVRVGVAWCLTPPVAMRDEASDTD